MAKRKTQGDPRIIVVMNQKGGVGKTTTAVNLAASLGRSKYRVLLVDIDPQGNATSGLGFNKGEADQTVYDVLLSGTPAEDASSKTDTANVWLLPSTIQLAGAEIELVNTEDREHKLQQALQPVKDKYDFLVIDCPPSLGLLTINAMVAGTEMLIPIQCEYYALEGVSKLMDSIKRIQAHLNPDLKTLGIVMTMYDSRTSLSKQVLKEVHSYFDDLVFKTVIHRSVRLSEAPSYGQPVIEYAPMSKGAKAYRNLAKEVIKRG